MTLIDQVLEQMKPVNETSSVQNRATQLMLDTIDTTVVSGNFEIAKIELDSDGETDHVYGVIRPKDAIGLRMLGIEAGGALLEALTKILGDAFKGFDVPVLFDARVLDIGFDIRIDRT